MTKSNPLPSFDLLRSMLYDLAFDNGLNLSLSIDWQPIISVHGRSMLVEWEEQLAKLTEEERTVFAVGEASASTGIKDKADLDGLDDFINEVFNGEWDEEVFVA